MSGRWRKLLGLSTPDAIRPVVVPVQARWSLNQITTYRYDLKDELFAAAAAGFTGVGLWRTKLSAYADEAVLSLLHEHGLTASSVSWAGGFTGSLGFSFEEALEEARDAVRLTAMLGAETLIVMTGGQNGHILPHCRKTVRDALLLLADEASDRGVKLAVLPMPARLQQDLSFLHGIDDTLKFLDEVKHPGIGLAFDTFHLWQTPNLLGRIAELVPRTFVVQVSDSPVDPKDRMDGRLPGQGALPLPEILHRFLAEGYQGYFDVQVWSEDVWRMPHADVIAACRAFEPTVSGAVTRFA
jgi:sugar phosphate isomerase/epimerase